MNTERPRTDRNDGVHGRGRRSTHDHARARERARDQRDRGPTFFSSAATWGCQIWQRQVRTGGPNRSKRETPVEAEPRSRRWRSGSHQQTASRAAAVKRKATAMTGVEKAEAERLRAECRNAAKRVKRAAAATASAHSSGRCTICYPFWGSLLSLLYQRVSAMYQES